MFVAMDNDVIMFQRVMELLELVSVISFQMFPTTAVYQLNIHGLMVL